jgi:signal peptidase I
MTFRFAVSERCLLAGRVTVAKTKSTAKNVAVAKRKETTVEFLASLAAVLATGLFIITFCLQAFAIPSSSMENTLLVGDHVFVNRIQFAPKSSWLGPLLPYRDIRRGDVVVFLSPQTPGLYIVKRIIGVPGDRIHLRDGVVYRNEEKLDEPYVLHDADNSRDYYRNNFPAVQPSDRDGLYDIWETELPSRIQGEDVVVPPDKYFGMGDHRGVSLDSRYWGFIPRQNVIGRPMFIYWSFETSGDQYLKNSAGDRISFLAHVVVHFFGETRWSRTLRVVR